MNSEAAKNPVLDVRKELEALRDKYRSLARQDKQVVEDVDALLQRIPEGWEMRAREPSVTMVRAAADLGAPFGVGAFWVAMWDAAGEEAEPDSFAQGAASTQQEDLPQ